MLALALAALIGTAYPQDPPVVQTPPTVQAPATDLDDIEVVGRPLDTMIRDFVGEVAAPNRGRGIARWESDICIGVANLRGELRQYILDRVSTVADDIGLNPGAPGCTPNVLIIASDQPDALAKQLVEERGGTFRVGGSGMDRGGDALEDFVESDAPVRWWQVSMPTDSQTGERAVSIPGQCTGSCSSPYDYAPVISTFAASRLSTQIVDVLFRTIVIVDFNQLSSVSAQQLADYIAMVSLAQIDPKADTSRYASILNVFEDPEAAYTLTNWDLAYLNGLYDAERTRANRRSGRSEIADSIGRAHRTLQQTDQE
jgi:hypothetical protein